MPLTFTSRKAIVTGAGRGIGRAIALELARNGVAVACVSLHESSCNAVVDEIVMAKGVAKAFACDVSDPVQVKATCEQIAGDPAFGNIDILVNNAGITSDGMFMRMTEDSWDSVMKTNLNSIFYFCKAIAPSMTKARWGRIINISSVIGLMGNAGQANYAAAKAGALGITKSLALELAPRNITVNAVCPGFIKTDMTDKLTEEQKAGILNWIPLKRMGAVEEVAQFVTFLASEEAGYITGQSLAIDGGMVRS